MKTQTVLKRGLVNYFDQEGQFHKCFAVSNGDIFVFWFGGIHIANPFVNATFEESDEVSLHHFSIVNPDSVKCYELMEKHFNLCITLSNMEYPHEFATIGFSTGEYMMDIPGFDEKYERQHVFHHHNNEAIHAVFGDPLDGGYQFIQLILGAMEEATEEFLQMEKEQKAYKDLKATSGAVLKDLCGFDIPADSSEISVFYEFDGGISQLLEDKFGNIHIFHRDGNDHFTYCEPLDNWFVDNKSRLVSKQQEYSKMANMYQQIINNAFLNQ